LAFGKAEFLLLVSLRNTTKEQCRMCCSPLSCVFAAAAILKILLFFVVVDPSAQDY
jgi:hypothetical protein